MSQILGITGDIGSGKTTFAQLLCDMAPSHATYETSELIAEVAEDFNRALSGEFAFETASSNIELVNQALIWFIESISEKLHRDEVTWNQLAITQHQLVARPELFEKLLSYLTLVKKQTQLLDQRITNENKETYRPLLQWIGGYLVAKVGNTIWYDEIFRRVALHDDDKDLVVIGGVRYPSDAISIREHDGLVVGLLRSGLSADRTDVTESSRNDIKPDIIVHNNGTLDELRNAAERLWNDLSVSSPKQNYNAHL